MSEFDAIVVGSGISGGWAAKELTERGLKVLLIERGRMIEHQSGYENETKAPWEMPLRGFGDPQLWAEQYAVQKGTMDEWTQPHFVNDADNPYQTSDGDPFKWIRGYQMGGRSLIWGRQCYRWSDYDFGANARDGHGTDWPVRYADLSPYYDRAEEFIGVNGTLEGLPQLPDGKFQPAMPLGAAEQLLKERVAAHYDDRRVIPGRAAHLTVAKPEEGRAKCQFRNICARGCSFGAYFSTQSSTLPAARRTGRLTVLTDTIVASVEHDPVSGRAVAVHTINTNSKALGRHSARIFFLNASTMNTVGLLLRSKSDAFPNGLANSSGVLGHYIMDHALTMSGMATVPELADRTYYGSRPNNFIVPRFKNLDTPAPGLLRGYSFQGAAFRASWRRGGQHPGIGASLHDDLQGPGEWRIFLVGFAECLPRKENRITLSNKVDQWGLQQFDIRLSYGDNEHALLKDAEKEAADMLALLGGTKVRGGSTPGEPGSAIHEMGGARMGADPATSVVNRFSQTHDVPNIFVTDGAAMSSTACQNPSLTYMAFTIRAAKNAVSMLQEGVL